MTIIIVPNEPNPNMTGRHYGVAKALSAQGHDVHTLMWDLPHQMNRKDLVKHVFTSLFTKTYAYEDLTLHKLARLPLFWPVINGWLFKRQVRKLYAQLGADIIFAQSYTNETLIPAELPFIYDLADDYAAPAEVYGSAVYKFAFKILGVRSSMAAQARNALAVTAVSDVLVRWAAPYNSQVTKLPNGVETDLIGQVLATKTTKKPAKHSMIYVSGFGPWSQPLAVMRATVTLRKTVPDISLTLVGEGSEVAAIKQFITDNNASAYITYQGFVHDRAEVFKLINQHAIGLNISEKNIWRDAAHPMKVIEYSALGKKVVSTNLAGVEALQLPNVYMFANDSDGSNLQQAMVAALQAPDGTHATLSAQIRKEYDWTSLIKRLEGLVDSSLVTHNRPQVIHVTPSYPPALGGLEKVVEVLAATQQKSGLKVSVLTALQPRFGTPDSDFVPVQRFHSFVVANTTIIFGLLRALFTIPSNKVVHLHITQAFTPEAVWLASRLKKFQYVAHIHLDVPASGFAGFLLGTYKRLILRQVLRSARYVIVFTKDQQADVCAKYNLAADSVVVIPNGAEDSFFNDTPRTLHKKPRLLFVGRFGYQKNLQLLLHALDGISDKFQTTLVGDGELKVELQELAKSLKLQNVTFAGRADGEQLRAFYEQADIFVLPSEREGMPLVLLEAMAMGLPIVATDVTGSRDVVINGSNGLLVPLGDIQAFQAALQTVTESSIYVKLQSGARSAAVNYSWNKLVARFEPLYEEIV